MRYLMFFADKVNGSVSSDRIPKRKTDLASDERERLLKQAEERFAQVKGWPGPTGGSG
jgi:hypothetical protein